MPILHAFATGNQASVGGVDSLKRQLDSQLKDLSQQVPLSMLSVSGTDAGIFRSVLLREALALFDRKGGNQTGRRCMERDFLPREMQILANRSFWLKRSSTARLVSCNDISTN